ncbi:MAG TPA: hypothetical protein PKZ97_10220 [Azospirillaceae bacterium]|nr:hypothetical protein [Azospirillaceae bacterium]
MRTLCPTWLSTDQDSGEPRRPRLRDPASVISVPPHGCEKIRFQSPDKLQFGLARRVAADAMDAGKCKQRFSICAIVIDLHNYANDSRGDVVIFFSYGYFYRRPAPEIRI